MSRVTWKVKPKEMRSNYIIKKFKYSRNSNMLKTHTQKRKRKKSRRRNFCLSLLTFFAFGIER